MQDRFTTISGWVLFSGIIALGSSIASGMYFHAGKIERPETMGFPIAGVVEAGGASGPTIAQALAAADPAAGEKIFAKCTSCHSVAQGGANGIGPNLYGTVGEPIGQGKAGFAFSDALSGHGGNWDFASLDQWLTSPKAFAAGTKMSFAGLSKIEDRANVIAYLNAQGSNLPLPKPEAPAAAAAGDKAAAAAAAGDPSAAAGPAEKPGPEAAGAAASVAPTGGKVGDKAGT
ncbi:MAG: cytochrome c family protein [Croceibacterium sp.]